MKTNPAIAIKLIKRVNKEGNDQSGVSRSSLKQISTKVAKN